MKDVDASDQMLPKEKIFFKSCLKYFLFLFNFFVKPFSFLIAGRKEEVNFLGEF